MSELYQEKENEYSPEVILVEIMIEPHYSVLFISFFRLSSHGGFWEKALQWGYIKCTLEINTS